MPDLFERIAPLDPPKEIMAEGAVLLRGTALAFEKPEMALVGIERRNSTAFRRCERIAQIVELDKLFPFVLLGKPAAHPSTPHTHEARDMVTAQLQFKKPPRPAS